MTCAGTASSSSAGPPKPARNSTMCGSSTAAAGSASSECLKHQEPCTRRAFMPLQIIALVLAVVAACASQTEPIVDPVTLADSVIAIRNVNLVPMEPAGVVAG